MFPNLPQQGRSQIQEIKEKLDIIQVAEKYLTNMKHSGPNYFALCPFHNEKTPSFSINQDLQIYKCFGCGESGDVITFIQKIEGLDFPKALEKAAQMAGVQLMSYKPDPKREKEYKEKQRIIEANTLAATFYNHLLLNHKNGEIAREYCKNRKITKPIIEKFQIGYAPKGYDNLKRFLQKHGFEENDLLKWGLLVMREDRSRGRETGESKAVDKFRFRLMFPIFNHQGEIIGFSGRQIEKSDYGPKYLNSPETLVYKKKETMYGLFQAKDEIRRRGFVILVEGNVDILSSHRVGVPNIVCPLGTALTLEQCKLVRRYAEKVYFRFDTDEAGEKALLRGLEIAENAGLESSALDIGEYQDVDELIMNEPKKWQQSVDQPMEVVEHLINRFSKKFDLTSAKGKSGFIKQIGPYIKAIADPIEKDEYVKKIAVLVEVEESLVLQSVEDVKIATKKNAAYSPEKITEPVSNKKNAKVRITQKEYLAAIFIQKPQLVRKFKELGKIFDEWFVVFLEDLGNGKKLNDLTVSLDVEKKNVVEKLAMLNTDIEDIESYEKAAKKLVLDLRKKILRKEVDTLKRQIKKAEIQNSDYSKLLDQVKANTVELKKLAEVTSL